ncbi:Cuticle protein 2 [Papilio machaon]|uniref:Cuticle protein 2 n=1 Tax=Papilio machaon TaxID=76193 RepID=A0A0N0PDN0_PAPMA|nr:Cuticle protein 2 [Papilio machaon]
MPNAYISVWGRQTRIKAQEVGQTPHGTQAEGAFSYVGDDGHVYTVQYVADEHGFRAQGAHLPTPPPIPEAILKSLEQNAKDEANGIVDDVAGMSYCEEVCMKVYDSRMVSMWKSNCILETSLVRLRSANAAAVDATNDSI